MAFDKISHLIFGLSFICILLTLVAIGAQAQEHDGTQAHAISAQNTANHIQDIIRQQLDAINDRDADKAYALTGNSMHEKFDTAKEYLSHLRLQSRAIYNHENYKFLEHTSTHDGAIQKVRMEDRYGEPVTVIYRLEKQDGDKWLIDSFAVLALEGSPI